MTPAALKVITTARSAVLPRVRSRLPAAIGAALETALADLDANLSSPRAFDAVRTLLRGCIAQRFADLLARESVHPWFSDEEIQAYCFSYYLSVLGAADDLTPTDALCARLAAHTFAFDLARGGSPSEIDLFALAVGWRTETLELI